MAVKRKSGRPVKVPGEKETKEKILDAAIDLFAARGYDHVTIRDIAAAVGIKESSIYKHYSGKEEILGKIFEYVLLRWDQSKVGRWSDSDEAEAQIVSMGLDGFMAMAIGVSGSWLEDPRMEKIMRIAFIELYHNDQVKNFMLTFFGAGPEFFEASFAILMKHRLIKPADPKVLTDEYMSFYMMALVDHFLLRYGSSSKSFVEEYGARIEEHNEFFKNAIRP
ncbi:TetR/AcrR family transcriptional regulator [Methanocella paludicola]|nr:TetR/AcrR family transcriptional regulator [Methanocella paludicola]